jgi:hypothetical protein
MGAKGGLDGRCRRLDGSHHGSGAIMGSMGAIVGSMGAVVGSMGAVVGSMGAKMCAVVGLMGAGSMGASMDLM